MSNRFATLARDRANGNTERLTHDEYETPDEVTSLLFRYVKFFGPVLEPACGSGRIVQNIEARGLKVEARDIRAGQDFLDTYDTWHGDIITNPPYHEGMADSFVARALAITTGKIAMLLQSGFLFGDKRTRSLYEAFPPAMVITVPWRILFYLGKSDETIRSQAYNHCWFVWDNQRLERAQTQLVFPKLTAPY